MSNYNQVGQGRPDQKQQGDKLGAGQNPPPKPGQQADLPDQSDQKSRATHERGEEDASGGEEGLIHQLPGGEGG